MKKFSYVQGGKVITQEGIAMVKTRSLDDTCTLSMTLL